MIIDVLPNLKNYVTLIPELKTIETFISSYKLEEMTDGRTDMKEINAFVNIQTIPCKTKGEAVLESHIEMIDLQIPLTSDEVMGYSPLSNVTDAPYDKDKDLKFHIDEPESYINIRKGMFVIFFPQDAHAPGITETPLKKAVFKIPVNK